MSVCNKKWKTAYDRIGLWLGYLQAKAYPVVESCDPEYTEENQWGVDNVESGGNNSRKKQSG